MRPIERGNIPTDRQGKAKVFRQYRYARRDLIDRLGEYCSYCEMHLDTSLAVEHVRPKTHHPNLALQWDNFLLACTNCNSIKGSKDINLADYYWPDLDNTARAIEYLAGGRVHPHSSLAPAQKSKAQRTIALTGLDRIPLIYDTSASDRRWNNRREAWDIAVESLNDLNENDRPSMRRQIVRTALAQGFWSVWMTVFRDDLDMVHRFIEAFTGTCRACFDHSLNKVTRGTI
jgi:uncharacterized protein (TIGR02646 family)